MSLRRALADEAVTWIGTAPLRARRRRWIALPFVDGRAMVPSRRSRRQPHWPADILAHSPRAVCGLDELFIVRRTRSAS